MPSLLQAKQAPFTWYMKFFFDQTWYMKLLLDFKYISNYFIKGVWSLKLCPCFLFLHVARVWPFAALYVMSLFFFVTVYVVSLTNPKLVFCRILINPQIRRIREQLNKNVTREVVNFKNRLIRICRAGPWAKPMKPMLPADIFNNIFRP